MSQKRFSGRDFIFLIFLSVLVLLLILLMYQIDRQWSKLSEMERTVTSQAKDLSAVRSQLNQWGQTRLISGNGVLVGSDSSESDPIDFQSNQIPAAFSRAQQATRQKAYAQGGWKVNAFGNSLKTITPFISSDVYSSNVQSYVLESLLERNPETLEWDGLLAKSWQISEDGLTITFQLRENATFSDGKPVTADDVQFSYDFAMNEAIKAPRERAYYEKIEKVVAKGQYEVEFTFKEPYFEALGLAGGIDILAKHFYGDYLTDAETFNTSKGLLFGSGPYKLTDPKNWSPDKGGVELVRNTRYWGPVQPPFEKILWRVIQNDSARLTTYRNGEIDAYSARPVEYKKLKNDVQMIDKSHNFEYMSPTAGYSYIAWNQHENGKATRFADKRVRQAMTYLTNRETIIRDIYLGYAEPAISPFSPRSKQHDKKLQPRKADIAKAKSLLKEAGYEDRNNDGVLENTQNEDFEFELVYFQDSEDTKRMVLLLKDMYARAGVKLVPKPSEWPVMLDMLEKKNFDAITLGWSSGVETDVYQMFHSSQAKTDGDNFISYKNENLDKLIDKARATVDEAERMPLWQQAEAVFYEDQPYTFLMRRKSLIFYDKRFHNLGMSKLGLNASFIPLETYVPAALQKYH